MHPPESTLFTTWESLVPWNYSDIITVADKSDIFLNYNSRFHKKYNSTNIPNLNEFEGFAILSVRNNIIEISNSFYSAYHYPYTYVSR